MYQLGLCELHCWKLHGGDKMLGHYLLISTYKDLHTRASYDTDDEESDDTDEEEDDEDIHKNIFEAAEYNNEHYAGELANTRHIFIRNYAKIIQAPNYIKPEIVEVIILETGETIAILKTFWLRIFQRMWRRKFAKWLSIIKNINNINMSRLTGRLIKRL